MTANVPDLPRLYTAFAEWGSCLIYILIMCRRYPKRYQIIISACALAFQAIFLSLTGTLPVIWWMPCMIIAILTMFGYILLCCKVHPYEAGFNCCRAFVLAEFTASFEWQIQTFIWPADQAFGILQLAFMFIVYSSIYFFIWFIEQHQKKEITRLDVGFQELSLAAVIAVIIFLISNLSYVFANTPFSGQYPQEIRNIRTLVDLGGFAILYAYYVQCCQTQTWREMEAMQSVLQNQYTQYRQSRESIELINRKYHDLKHQISALRSEHDPEKRNEWLDEMEADIKTYEAQNKTGNSVLDTVLTSKSLYCQKHGITLTCVADGTLIGFMDVMDICSVFGNALDNAIECEKKIEDKEKRLIHVSVSAQKAFVLMCFENYYEGELEFLDGLPVTTKQDSDYHGYGIKSIRYTAKKYGGTVTVQTQDSWFLLKVLFPITGGK